MSIEVLEPEVIHETEVSNGSTIPPLYGKCPVCGKPLYPRDKNTNELVPKYMFEKSGRWKRAKCDACGAIIVYLGNGKWDVWSGKFDSEEDEKECK
jgi:hypothetical protein